MTSTRATLAIRLEGNTTDDGELIRPTPVGDFYSVTNPEYHFATEADAVATGFRRSKV